MQSINPDIERKEILNRYRGLLRDCRDKTNKEEKKRTDKAMKENEKKLRQAEIVKSNKKIEKF